MAIGYSHEESDLIEIIQNSWDTDTREAENVLRKFIQVFGMEGAEKHLKLNASMCVVADISPHNYLELCGIIERTVNTSNTGHTYFVVGIRNLLMAKHVP